MKTEQQPRAADARRVTRAGFFWNMAASTIAAGQSALLLIVVKRAAGLEAAGIFTLAWSTAQMLMTIGYFDMRSFQVTDVKKEIPFPVYLASRILTCAAMLAASGVYILFKGYGGYKALVVMLACILKMTDALEDVLQGLFQKRGRMDIAGRLQALRFGLVIVAFCGVLAVTGQLVSALLASIAVSVLVIAVLNFPMVGRYDSKKPSFDFGQLGGLFLACLPLFIGSYLSSYMENAPKYAIDAHLRSEELGIYGLLAMTAFVVNLFAGFAFRPMLTPLALRWQAGKRRTYLKMIAKLLGWVVLLTAVIAAAAWLLGIPVLAFVFGEDLRPYRKILLIIIIAGGINSFGTMLYYALTVMRRQRWLLCGYIVSAAAAWAMAGRLVSSRGLDGAALAFLLSVIVRSMIFTAMFFIAYKKKPEEPHSRALYPDKG